MGFPGLLFEGHLVLKVVMTYAGEFKYCALEYINLLTQTKKYQGLVTSRMVTQIQ